MVSLNRVCSEFKADWKSDSTFRMKTAKQSLNSYVGITQERRVSLLLHVVVRILRPDIEHNFYPPCGFNTYSI